MSTEDVTTESSSKLLEVIGHIEAIIGVVRGGHSFLDEVKENGPKVRDFISTEEKRIPTSIYGGVGIIALIWALVRRGEHR